MRAAHGIRFAARDTAELWSLGASPPRGHTRLASNDCSASLLSGYGRQLGRRSAGDYLSGRAIVKPLVHMEQLNPLMRACGDDPAVGRTLVDVFSGNSPAYALLKHPAALARTVREIVVR